MPDQVIARNKDAKFAPHPEGMYPGICVDVIDLGDKVEDYTGQPKKLSPKCALVFRTGEKNMDTGEFIDIAREFTVSTGELANLRKFLESWRGKKYDDNALNEGLPVHKLCGQWALLSVEHKTSGKGRTYANILTAVPVPKQMKASLGEFPEYKRADYWETRKKEYATAAAAFRAEHAVAPAEPEDESQEVDDTDDLDSSLPF